MKSITLIFLFCLMLALPKWGMTQGGSHPDHRFAIRWNTLGLLNLNGIGEFEYGVTDRFGLLAGGGSSVGLVYPHDAYGYANPHYKGCKSSDWGIYLGARMALPLGKLTGLSAKVFFSYQHDKLFNANSCTAWIPDVPQPPTVVFRQMLGGYVCVAYAQTFLKRLFVEPVVGIGPQLYANGVRAKFSYNGIDFPIQLNLGVRF